MASTNKTPNLNLNQWIGTDRVQRQDFNNDNLIIDGKFDDTDGHKHTGAPGDGPKLGSNSLESGAATDTVIGNRTISDASAPSGNTGTLTAILGWLANRIKAITGKTNWYDSPTKNLEQLNATKVEKSGDNMTGHLTLENNIQLRGNDTTNTPVSLATVGTDNRVALGSTSKPTVIRSSVDIQANINGTEYKVWHAGNDGAGSGLDADTVDGKNPGNNSGDIAVNNGLLNTNLNADMVDGKHAGNNADQIPINNGTINTNLNADMVDGKHASDFAPASHVGSGGSAHALATTSTAGFMSAADKAKLDAIPANAEPNQNAFSNVKVGSDVISADNTTDTLEIEGGSNISVVADTANDKVTISVTGSVPNATQAANADTVDGMHASDFAPANHTHPVATSSSAGFMSAADKAKLDSLQPGGQPNQNAFSNVKVGSNIVSADNPTDTLELIAGSNIALSADTTNDAVTISVTGTVPSATNADKLDNLDSTQFVRSDLNGTVQDVSTRVRWTNGFTSMSGNPNSFWMERWGSSQAVVYAVTNQAGGEFIKCGVTTDGQTFNYKLTLADMHIRFGTGARWLQNETTKDNFMYQDYSTGNYWVQRADGTFQVYAAGVKKFEVPASGTKTGGFIVIDNKNIGMSPIDSPRVLIEDVLFDYELQQGENEIVLDEIFTQVIHEKYAVFPGDPRVRVLNKEKGKFTVYAEEALTCDFRIIGERVDSVGRYFVIEELDTNQGQGQ